VSEKCRKGREGNKITGKGRKERKKKLVNNNGKCRGETKGQYHGSEIEKMEAKGNKGKEKDYSDPVCPMYT